MKNRNLSSPILSAVVLLLITNAPLVSKGDMTIPASAISTPATVPSPEVTTQPVLETVQPTPAKTVVAAAPTTAAKAPAAKHTASYTVVKGDSWTSIAQKFNTTRKKLKALNNLSANTVKPGQILLVPSLKNSKSSAVAKATLHHDYLQAQPVQDFDVPASTFASCPVPLPSEDVDADSSTSSASSESNDAEKPAPIAQLVSPGEVAAEAQSTLETEKPAPVAKLVSPAELAAAEEQDISVAPATPTPAPTGMESDLTPSGSTKFTKPVSSYSSEESTSENNHSVTAYNPPAPKPHRTLAQILGFASSNSASANDWGNRFLTQARALGNEGIEYDEDWRPPGDSHYWTMDCSNTTRYLYKVTAGIQLPRTASDQYYYLHLQGKAWDVPQTDRGLPDTAYLQQNLKPGDLLFWENTYRPDRQPPITHVMVFLGANDKGQWIMAGSQGSRGGEHNRRNGGPDIYIFRPSQPCGGYTTWLGMVHHTGRFCAFGRPLEADPAKLAMAEND
jgi:cell wall-associated NlpC family hydrolase